MLKPDANVRVSAYLPKTFYNGNKVVLAPVIQIQQGVLAEGLDQNDFGV